MRNFSIDLRINFGSAKTSYDPIKLSKNIDLAKKYKIGEDIEVARELDYILERIFMGARYYSSLKTDSGFTIRASKNAKLTTLLKGSNKPMIDSGNLMYNAIKVKSKTTNLMMSISIYLDKKDPNYEIYRKLANEDIEIPVTESVRNMFKILHQVSIGIESPDKLTGRAAELYAMNKEWYPLRPETTKIIIPRRDYWNILIKSKKLESFMIKVMKKTLRITLKTIKTGKL